MKLLGMPDHEVERVLVQGAVLRDGRKKASFQVGELVARGGMGEVYRAVRLNDGAPCAIKCVRADMLRDAKVGLRTRNEAIAFCAISHPNVVRAHGMGEVRNGIPWMAMEWLEGWTLQQILEQRGRLPIRWSVEITRDVCRGLRAIHEFAVHRDVKPSNIHLGKDGVTRVLDLGAALPHGRDVRLTSTGYQIGTLPFMAPEQVDDAMGCDARCDMWAVTAVFYMLMTGQHPLAVKGRLPTVPYQLAHRIVMEPHRPLLDLLPGAPAFFGEIIDKGLEKHPGDRYATAEDMVRVLNAALAWLEHKSGHAEPLNSLVTQLTGEVEAAAVAPPQLSWAPKPEVATAVRDGGVAGAAPKPPLKDVAPLVPPSISEVDAATTPRRQSLPDKGKGTVPMGVQSVAAMSPATYAAALADMSPAAPSVSAVRALQAGKTTVVIPRPPRREVDRNLVLFRAILLFAALATIVIAWLGRDRWLPVLAPAPTATAIAATEEPAPVAAAKSAGAAATAAVRATPSPSVAASEAPVAPRSTRPYRAPVSRPPVAPPAPPAPTTAPPRPEAIE